MKKKTTRTVGSAGLVLRWVPVTDSAGQTRMEMRWSAPAAIPRRAQAA